MDATVSDLVACRKNNKTKRCQMVMLNICFDLAVERIVLVITSDLVQYLLRIYFLYSPF